MPGRRVLLVDDVRNTGQTLAHCAARVKEAGVEGMAVRADVSSQADVDVLIRGALERFGRIDLLANVAGVMDGFKAAHEMDDATWERVMAINLTGPLRLSRAVLPSMMERKAGVIVNIASVAGLRGGVAGAAYTASKHALIGLTRSIAATYRSDGIRCSAICPGGVKTNIGRSMGGVSQWAMARLQPSMAGAGGAAQPDAIAALVSWLASDEAANVNGAVITDDGGWTAA